jgi:hypothetical protein
MNKILLSVSISIGLFILPSCKKEKSKADVYLVENDSLSVNQIQILASHNSYKIRTEDTIIKFLGTLGSLLPSNLDPADLDYTHENFDVQMSNYNIRGLEIDIYNDPVGGDFYNRKMNSFVNLPESSGEPSLLSPGFKVLHIKDVDYKTHYFAFKQSLQAIKDWSKAHPNHLPLFVNIETKSESPGDEATLAQLGFRSALPFDADAVNKIDEEFKSIFGHDLKGIITPDLLRGNLATLNEVVTTQKWPRLGECRGKIFFILQGQLTPFYKSSSSMLSGRVMFTYETNINPFSVFMIYNDPVSAQNTIRQRVEQGYIVRTRSDVFQEARDGDYSRLNLALSSGAQIISTDYYKPDARGGVDPNWSTYKAELPRGVVGRKNPVNASLVMIDETLRE